MKIIKTRSALGKLLLAASLLLVISSLPSQLLAFNYVINDFNFYPIPDIPRPQKGVTFQDPTFHTSITRITDSPTEVHSASYGDYAQAGYPKHDIENSNGTRLMVQSYSSPGWHIYDAQSPYSKIKDFPSVISGATDPDPRWDKNSGRQNYLYFTSGTVFYKWDITTNSAVALHDFQSDFPGQALSYVSSREEGDASDNSRYWAYMVYDTSWNDIHNVVYDKDFYSPDNGKVISILSPGDTGWAACNGITMSPSGNYVVCSDYNYVWDRNLQNRHTVAACCSHFDLGYDADGDEMLVDVQSYNNAGWIRMCKLSDNTCYWLAPLGTDRWGGTHVSCNNTLKPGWALVSTWTPNYPGVPSDWSGHALLMYEMKKISNPSASNHTRIWRLANTYTVRKGYSDDPFGKINFKGTKVWWTSGWGFAYGDTGYQGDIYQIDLPSTWYQDLMSGDTTAPSAPTGVTVN